MVAGASAVSYACHAVYSQDPRCNRNIQDNTCNLMANLFAIIRYRLAIKMEIQSCLLEVPAVLDLIPGPDNLLQLFLLTAVTSVHIRVQHFDQGFVRFADIGFC